MGEELTIILEVIGFFVVLFIVGNSIPYHREKTGKVSVISYGTFPFSHTTLVMATYSYDSRQYIAVEGKLTALTDGKPLQVDTFMTVKYKHIPLHYYDTLESVTQRSGE